MSKRVEQEHAEARALEDAAWDLKGAAEAFHGRAMTAESARVLASAKRDVERVLRSVQAEWDRRLTVRKRETFIVDEAIVGQSDLELDGGGHG